MQVNPVHFLIPSLETNSIKATASLADGGAAQTIAIQPSFKKLMRTALSHVNDTLAAKVVERSTPMTQNTATVWPSGLRRSTQVRVSSEAWVRIPSEP